MAKSITNRPTWVNMVDRRWKPRSCLVVSELRLLTRYVAKFMCRKNPNSPKFTQSDLEYDPALYQRDRGEADWDTRSISTMAMGSTMTGSTFFNGGKYDRYLNHGPAGHQEYEMGKLDSMEEPLLSPRSMALQQQGFSSQQTLIPYVSCKRALFRYSSDCV